MLARDYPDRIKLTKNGEIVHTADEAETLEHVEEWNTKTIGAQAELLADMVPDKLKDALRKRRERQVGGGA